MWGQSLDDDPTWHKIDYSDAVTRIIVSTHTGSFEKCFGFLISFGNKDGDIYFLQVQDDDIEETLNNASCDIYIQNV